MKPAITLVAAVLLFFAGFLFGKNLQPGVPQGVILNSGPGLAEIQAVTDGFLQAWNEKDFDACAVTYANDAVFMSPGIPALHGREAVKQFFVDFRTTDTREMEIREQVKEVLYFGDWSVMRGAGQFSIQNIDSAPDEIPFKWAMLSKKNSSGNWETVWDILNDDI